MKWRCVSTSGSCLLRRFTIKRPSLSVYLHKFGDSNSNGQKSPERANEGGLRFRTDTLREGMQVGVAPVIEDFRPSHSFHSKLSVMSPPMHLHARTLPQPERDIAALSKPLMSHLALGPMFAVLSPLALLHCSSRLLPMRRRHQWKILQY